LFGQAVQALKQGGDDFLARVRYHANGDGSLSEQISRYNGYMISAADLTWNYASFLAASRLRDELLRQLNS
jgi:glucoamylase